MAIEIEGGPDRSAHSNTSSHETGGKNFFLKALGLVVKQLPQPRSGHGGGSPLLTSAVRALDRLSTDGQVGTFGEDPDDTDAQADFVRPPPTVPNVDKLV